MLFNWDLMIDSHNWLLLFKREIFFMWSLYPTMPLPSNYILHINISLIIIFLHFLQIVSYL
jgi:hypothetical protein